MRILLISFFSIIFSINTVFAQDVMAGDSESGLEVPRFVSLRSNRINARSGPGNRYPIEWVYMQKSAPVEIIAEFELWRKIKDWEGSESWVHKSMLTGQRTIKVTNLGENNLYSKDNLESKVIAKVEDEVVGEVISCQPSSKFCLIKFNNISGWIQKSKLFGIYPDEEIKQ